MITRIHTHAHKKEKKGGVEEGEEVGRSCKAGNKMMLTNRT